jgi:hypothetical protein
MTHGHTSVLIPIDVQRGFDYPPWPPRNNPAMESNGQPDGAGGVISADEIQRAHLATLRVEFAEVVDTDSLIAQLRDVAA